MRPIYENTVIQIDIAEGACFLSCANCTRHIGHHRSPGFMSLETISKAIDSLHGFPGRIGCMGGEPTLHPKFHEVLALFRERIPDKAKREFWTSGWKWATYKDDIFETFDRNRIAFNSHVQDSGKHQPLLVAIEEVVDDPELRKLLIDNCPFQARWSASITSRGAYFCEIAASMGQLFGIPGWPVEPGWWRKTPAEFQDQVETFCGKCSGALPLPAYSDGQGGRLVPTKDVISPGNVERLKKVGSPKVARGHYEVWDRKLTAEDIDRLRSGWRPRSFRPFEAHAPEDYHAASQG